MEALGSAISFVVSDGAKLRLWRNEAFPPLHRLHHFHGLIPHFVGFAGWVKANQITNPDELEEHPIAFIVAVVMLGFFAPSFGVCECRMGIGSSEMDNAFLAQASLARGAVHHDTILEQQCAALSTSGGANREYARR